MNVDDAFSYLVSALKQGVPLDKFGYEMYLERVICRYLKIDDSRMLDAKDGARIDGASPSFYTAAWDLCRRGILRPGVKVLSGNSDHKPGAINGYCITEFGRDWLGNANNEALSSVIPGRFVDLLSAHLKRFGAGYLTSPPTDVDSCGVSSSIQRTSPQAASRFA